MKDKNGEKNINAIQKISDFIENKKSKSISITETLSNALKKHGISYSYYNSLDPKLSGANDRFLKTTQLFDDIVSKLMDERRVLLEKLNEAGIDTETIAKHKQWLEGRKEDAEKEAMLEALRDQIQLQSELGNLIGQVNEEARERLFEDEKFRNLFEQKECKSFVLSIDIRRSTELMLKARDPLKFEEFIMSLCEELSNVIKKNYGIYDKFTGDGILAFFPDFYSGKDAGLMAVKSCIECHEIFNAHYSNHRDCFVSVMQDVGLGIGVDYGTTHLVKMGGNYTVVGTPVVYACRMSGGRAYDTLLNQVAYEEIIKSYKGFLNIKETSIEIKHEGKFLAYKVTSNGKPISIHRPDWDAIIEGRMEKMP